MFLLFAHIGGWEDFQGAFETLEAAEIAAKEWVSQNRWVHIVHDGKIVWEIVGNVWEN